VRLFEKHLPNHKIIPVDCRHLVFGQGAIHCSSMQMAAAKA
jgi:agmatine/peptidylarginine deiminase